MLLNLHIKNMALIQELEVDFRKGLNILTGETGAGKSIIIGSINVALGSKSFKDFARKDADYALAELVFSVEQKDQADQIRKMDIPIEDQQVIISRRLINGRSISKVNGETVPVSVVKKLAEILIDIHGQHEHQSLLYSKNHLQILDEFAKEELAEYKEKGNEIYKEFQHIKNRMEALKIDESSKAKEIDFLEFEVEEIQNAALKPGEDTALEAQYRKLANSKKIIQNVSEVYGYTGSERGDGVSENLGRALRSLSSVVDYDEELQELYRQLFDIENLMGDFNRDISVYMDNLSFDDSDFVKIEERLDLINHLKAKCGNSIEAVLEYKLQKEERLRELIDYDICMEKLRAKHKKCEEKLLENAKKISSIRKKHAGKLGQMICQGLIDLNFIEVDFQVAVEQTGTLRFDGYDEVTFKISTNPGEKPKALKDVASGGELSRIMLAIKTVLADKDATETLIFDEIDVGISGRTAQKVSEKLSVIAKNHQIICITHLAQIASMSDSHYVIEKEVKENTTITSIRELTENESVQEIARILGGARITETVLESAKEMKDLAGCTKKY